MLGAQGSACLIQLSEIKDDDNTPGVHRSQDRLGEAQVHSDPQSQWDLRTRPCHRLKVTAATWRRCPGVNKILHCLRKTSTQTFAPQIQVFKHKLQGIRVAQFSVYCAGLVH